MPDIYKYLDAADIAGLIAPRQLLIEMGVHDTRFFIARSTASADQLEGFEALQRIYRAAGAEEDLWKDMHPGEHAFANNLAHEFFGKYL